MGNLNTSNPDPSSKCICCHLLSAVICYLLLDEGEKIYKEIQADICAKLHPRFPCKFWKEEYGAVPGAVLMTPFNDEVLLEGGSWCGRRSRSQGRVSRSAYLAWRAPR